MSALPLKKKASSTLFDLKVPGRPRLLHRFALPRDNREVLSKDEQLKAVAGPRNQKSPLGQWPGGLFVC
jgi:hypothetical protein